MNDKVVNKTQFPLTSLEKPDLHMSHYVLLKFIHFSWEKYD